jgi:hypothetical protein
MVVTYFPSFVVRAPPAAPLVRQQLPLLVARGRDLRDRDHVALAELVLSHKAAVRRVRHPEVRGVGLDVGHQPPGDGERRGVAPDAQR